VAAGLLGAREERQRRRGRARGPIVRMNGVAPAGLGAMLTQQPSGGGIEELGGGYT
jgi:hypothetical protein